jgi:CheY-like chemotaxis protein
MLSNTVQSDPSRTLILVAEDDRLIRTLITRLVTELAAVPVEVADGTAALAAVHAHGPSLRGAMLDVVMPGISGIAVAAAIQQQGIPIPIVLMSGGIPATLLDDLFQLRPITLLPKPFDVADVRTLLQRMVLGDPPGGADSGGPLAPRG